MMTLWRLTAREIRRRPGRATFTLLSIAIGVAAIVSVSLGAATTRRAHQEMYRLVTGRAALQVTADGNGRFEQNVVATVANIPGVQAAVPSVQQFTNMWFEHRHFQMLVMGISPAEDKKVREYELREGQFFQDREGLLLESQFARALGAGLGDEVLIQAKRGFPRNVHRLKIDGLLSAHGAAAFNNGGVIFLPLSLAQNYFTGRGKITAIDVVLDSSADEQVVHQRIAEVLPPGLQVHPPAARTQLAKETLAGIEHGLRLATVLLISLAVFMILNTFLMNVSERRRQLAVLRAVGATRWQIVGMFLFEGFVLGVAGTIIGCGLGIGGGYLLMQAFTRLFVAAPPPVVFEPTAFLAAAVLGPVLAVVAAAVPALLTTQIAPLEAMRATVPQDGGQAPWWLTLIGAAGLFGTVPLVIAAGRGMISPTLAIYATVMLMGAFVFFIPWLVGPLARAVVWLLSPLLRLEGRLAHRQVRRRPLRTALTAGVLYIAVTVGVGLGTTLINNIGEVRRWYNQTIVGDYYVRAMMPDASTETQTVPAEIGERIRKIPGVMYVDSIQYVTNVQAGDHAVVVVAREFNDPSDLALDLYQSDPAKVRRGLMAGEVVVGTALARHAGVGIGDTIKLGEKKFRVGGLVVDYLVGGWIVYMQRAEMERDFDVQGVGAFLIKAAPARRGEVGAELDKLCKDNGLMLQSFNELTALLDRIMGGVVGGLWAVLVLGFVVAALGIANTLTMSVLEQTRELALLRVVAMTRWQIRKMVLSEASIIGLIGLGLGLFFGLVMAFALSRSMMPLMGYPVPFVLHPIFLAGCFIMGLGLVLVASLLPAERAARLDLLIALQYG
jgi:putative ABC transport system permease protein